MRTLSPPSNSAGRSSLAALSSAATRRLTCTRDGLASSASHHSSSGATRRFRGPCCPGWDRTSANARAPSTRTSSIRPVTGSSPPASLSQPGTSISSGRVSGKKRGTRAGSAGVASGLGERRWLDRRRRRGVQRDVGKPFRPARSRRGVSERRGLARRIRFLGLGGCQLGKGGLGRDVRAGFGCGSRAFVVVRRPGRRVRDVRRSGLRVGLVLGARGRGEVPSLLGTGREAGRQGERPHDHDSSEASASRRLERVGRSLESHVGSGPVQSASRVPGKRPSRGRAF